MAHWLLSGCFERPCGQSRQEAGSADLQVPPFVLAVRARGRQAAVRPRELLLYRGRVTPETFRDVSTVVITHSHPDHLALEPLKQILALSGADVVTNGEVAAILDDEGIAATTIEEGTLTAGAFTLRAIPTPHEAILADTVPRHGVPGRRSGPQLWRLLGGSAAALSAGVEVLIMPVMAPFLTEVGVAAFAAGCIPAR